MDFSLNKEFLKKEFINEKTVFDWCFLCLGLVLQVVTYIVTKDALISFISGIFGVFAVIFTSQRKLSAYVFSLAQLLTYAVLLFQQHLYAAIFENVFYFVTLIMGIFLWYNHYGEEKGENKVERKKLSHIGWYYSCFLSFLGTFIIWSILRNTNDTQPFLDAVTTAPALVAEVLMILRYREQWWFWLFVDVLCVLLWWNAGNWCMVIQYIFWCANCVYGYIKWR